MKLALLGYGKMGKAIEQVAGNAHEFVLKISSGNANTLTPQSIVQADVAIEFSTPETAWPNIKLCLENNIPVVIGTTAWLDHYEAACSLCKQTGGAMLFASNFSIGVNLFFALNQYLGGLMNHQSQYEVSIKEIHHTQKKDAPSGTAITLAEDILKKLDQKTEWVNSNSPKANQIGIQSERIDPTPGTHTIEYHSDVDTIEIKHTAHSRMGFAKGALMAATWIQDKRGIFGMQDVLKIRNKD